MIRTVFFYFGLHIKTMTIANVINYVIKNFVYTHIITIILIDGSFL